MEVRAIIENGMERLRTTIEGDVSEPNAGSDSQELAGKMSGRSSAG
jgi:hypothetical protein